MACEALRPSWRACKQAADIREVHWVNQARADLELLVKQQTTLPHVSREHAASL